MTSKKIEPTDAKSELVDARPWVPLAGGDPAYVGDEVMQYIDGITATAVVARVSAAGNLYTAKGRLIGYRHVGTWQVRRAIVTPLPTWASTVIVPNHGYDYIEATWDGIVWRASEAVLGPDGRWHGIWRKAAGRGVLGFMLPRHITPGTWRAV